MGKETYSFTDSHEARKKHLSGRAHKANVKLWYDAIDTGAARTDGQWTPAGPATDLSLPPSLRPAPPHAFAILPAEWG
ncbi:hypothetical protein SPRG_07006 [Saprolegnia parasitica CBS 223.65]|uniref:U1-C C2H2-type zinc finger domain-containing protein n=1 Tax=Saprolegnia parasitica (strain CBS 223.65) TaxID=695850 RepID=A0A067CA87_SAPPC|nr:hypothetical protein SPRG_07006 [Saprolegnia parasitica CBS 223.65]KDO27418.1 hypothetical protein SPRG_07006 [Saprolegnia parasitica CBS 223.65]|eukprot:XP_012201858.1 hypothetical protein SPRG_07006 [Saprolegnia parasitica CBS 223.65]